MSTGWSENGWADMSNSRLDYCALLLSMKELLEEVLFQLREDEVAGVDPSASFLEAADMLDQFMSGMKRDLGI